MRQCHGRECRASKPAIARSPVGTGRCASSGGAAWGRSTRSSTCTPGQHLALKVLIDAPARTPSVERFKREARAASRIQSDHVVRVTDADVAAGARRGAVPRHGAARGARTSSTSPATRPASPADVRRVAAPGRARAREGARRGHRPPRPQAGEPLSHAARGRHAAREDPRLRHRQDGRRGAARSRSPVSSSGRRTTWRPSRPTATARRHGGAPTCTPLGLIAFRLLVGRSYWKSGQPAAAARADPGRADVAALDARLDARAGVRRVVPALVRPRSRASASRRPSSRSRRSPRRSARPPRPAP